MFDLQLTYDSLGSCFFQSSSEQVLDMKAGDLFIVRYSAVGGLVREGKAVLV